MADVCDQATETTAMLIRVLIRYLRMAVLVDETPNTVEGPLPHLPSHLRTELHAILDT